MHFDMHTITCNPLDSEGVRSAEPFKPPKTGMLRLMPRPPSPAMIGPIICAPVRNSASGLLDLTPACA